MSPPNRPDAVETVIAIPVRNEAERVAACLAAIDAQTGLRPGSLGIVLFLNNCSDGTAGIVEAQRARMSVPVRVIEVEFAGANAGWARRAAMDAAAEWLEAAGSAGTILSTDADTRVPPNWIERNLAAMAAGADAVAGRVVLDPDEAALLPPSLPARGRLEEAYDALLTEAEARIDPDPNDPWPCHRTTIGASLAVSLAAYRLVGGMPPMALGEDGAFVAALAQRGLSIGPCRRRGGDDLGPPQRPRAGRRRGHDPVALRAPRRPLRRQARTRLRRPVPLRLAAAPAPPSRSGPARAEHVDWARLLSIPPEEARRIAAIPVAGLAIAQAEHASPRLVYRPLGPKALPGQIRVAKVALVAVRAIVRIRDAVSAGALGKQGEAASSIDPTAETASTSRP